MKAGAGMNGSRVVLGGLVAALVLWVLTGVMNGALLSGQFQDWARGMGATIHPPAMGVAMGLWTLMSLIYGWVGVWLYAGIRPRFGAGPRTALIAGLALWAVSKLATGLDFIALGILPQPLVLEEAAGSLVAFLAAICCGAWCYRD